MTKSFILIPVHNRRDLTLGCLSTLRANGDLSESTAIVVDDGSSDGTADAVRDAFPEVILLHGDGQLFWTGAMALAMREAASRDAGAIFWLNDDCRPRPGALHLLRKHLTEHPCAVVGPQCIDSATGRTVTTGFVGRRDVAAVAGAPRFVHGLSGYCVGLGAGVMERLGVPDAKSFPHYWGDSAYTLRASRSGYMVVLLGDAVVDLVDHRNGIAPLSEHVRQNESWSANWHRVLGALNSPYRLRTLFPYLRLKYGMLPGTILAAGRAAVWMAQLVSARLFR
jgi:GT2 family glycosyltransferase